MALNLTFPEPVNELNIILLRKLVINGSKKYPGAVMIEENGRVIHLERSTAEQR